LQRLHLLVGLFLRLLQKGHDLLKVVVFQHLFYLFQGQVHHLQSVHRIQAYDVLLCIITVIRPLVLLARLHQADAVIVAQSLAGHIGGLGGLAHRKIFFHF